MSSLAAGQLSRVLNLTGTNHCPTRHQPLPYPAPTTAPYPAPTSAPYLAPTTAAGTEFSTMAAGTDHRLLRPMFTVDPAAGVTPAFIAPSTAALGSMNDPATRKRRLTVVEPQLISIIRILWLPYPAARCLHKLGERPAAS